MTLLYCSLICSDTEVGHVLFKDASTLAIQCDQSKWHKSAQENYITGIMFFKCHDVYVFLIRVLPYILALFVKSAS